MHKTPEIGKKYFWWHWNHHMRNQNKSWNVVFPIFDLLTGDFTKKKIDPILRKCYYLDRGIDE